MTTRWDEWLAAGQPHTLTQEQRGKRMAVAFEEAVFYDSRNMPRTRDYYLDMLKAERRQVNCAELQNRLDTCLSALVRAVDIITENSLSDTP
jgi:hypothetical protein